MADRANVTSADIVGQEGLGQSIPAVAQQVSALEKSMNFQFSSLQTSIQQAAEAIRKETALEIQRVNALIDAAEEKSEVEIRAAVAARDMEVKRIEMMIAAGDERASEERRRIEETQRREFEFFKTQLDKERQIIIERHDGIIANLAESLRSEMRGLSDVGLERMARFMEVKELHWAEHKETHAQEGEALKLAVDALDKRLSALNELRQMVQDRDKSFAPSATVQEIQKSLSDRVDREALDNRLRFERNDKESAERFNRLSSEIQASNARLENLINSKFEASGREYRAEIRPVQDARVGQGAIIASIGVVGALLGILVIVMNLVGFGV